MGNKKDEALGAGINEEGNMPQGQATQRTRCWGMGNKMNEALGTGQQEG